MPILRNAFDATHRGTGSRIDAAYTGGSSLRQCLVTLENLQLVTDVPKYSVKIVIQKGKKRLCSISINPKDALLTIPIPSLRSTANLDILVFDGDVETVDAIIGKAMFQVIPNKNYQSEVSFGTGIGKMSVDVSRNVDERKFGDPRKFVARETPLKPGQIKLRDHVQGHCAVVVQDKGDNAPDKANFTDDVGLTWENLLKPIHTAIDAAPCTEIENPSPSPQAAQAATTPIEGNMAPCKVPISLLADK
jgi:hypothetical protein